MNPKFLSLLLSGEKNSASQFEIVSEKMSGTGLETIGLRKGDPPKGLRPNKLINFPFFVQRAQG